MSRRTPTLHSEVPKNYCQVNPKDAAAKNIREGTEISLSTRRGTIEAKAQVTDDVPEGLIFLPFHFHESCANKITNPVLDPSCGMPEYKVCAVNIEVVK